MSKTIRLRLDHARALVAYLDNEAIYTPTTKAAETALRLAVEAADRLVERKQARRSPVVARYATTAGAVVVLGEDAPKFPKPKPGHRKARKSSAKDEHWERMRVIRGAIWIRAVRVDAGGRSCDPLCEKCGQTRITDTHHLFGRGKGRPLESERNCVGLCRPCHEEMQHPPSPAVAVECWDWAGRYLEDLGFAEEAAMAWARAKKYQTREELSRAGEAVRARKDEVA